MVGYVSGCIAFRATYFHLSGISENIITGTE